MNRCGPTCSSTTSPCAGSERARADDLHELISERQGRSLIITGNRAPSDWYPLFPTPIVAESLLDRRINTSHQAIMNGSSFRPDKRPKSSGGSGMKA
ncbi:ATP-binding protein [Streptomyces virginiae]|uniref:ATP-binding protein n=1 Tax=Streptomyces virginiae TaxID=1961 RepID=UPI0036250848